MDNENSTQPQRRTSKAAFVWFAIFILIAGLLLFRNRGEEAGGTVEWNQSEFETRLRAGEIRSAVIRPDGNGVLNVEGKYDAASAKTKNADGSANGASGKYKTMLMQSESLDALLKSSQVNVTVKGQDAFWNLVLSILPVLLIAVFIYFLVARQMKAAGRGAMQFGRSRARMIPPDELKVTFNDIAGADEAKEEVQELVEFLKDPLKFKLLGGRIPKGCLLTGEPGTGKTLLAKAVACEAKVPFFSISGSDFVEMFVGVGASRVRDMFDLARKNVPCLIFIDEIDAVGRSRFSGMGGGHDEREQTLNAMLVEMDGLESRSGVIVLAATNRPDVLDPALLRPGRFDRQIVLDLPDIAGRRQILNVHAKNIKVDDSVDLDRIARTTPGFSGADLANLCNEAALLAARENRESICQANMEEARDKVCYGRERRSRKISDRERRLTAYHEAGHTLVALYSEYATPVHKVTIIPRGRAYLGATFMMPKEDVYTKSKLELLADMTVSMGGRVAEELVIGDITSGAAADIEHLSHIARTMVCALGMNEKIGPIRYAQIQEHVHVRLDAPPADSFSPETAREIDIEVKKLVFDAHDRAVEMIKAHRDDLEKLAMTLLEKETVSIDEINVLLNREPRDGEISDRPAVDVRPEADGSGTTETPAPVTEAETRESADGTDGDSSRQV